MFYALPIRIHSALNQVRKKSEIVTNEQPRSKQRGIEAPHPNSFRRKPRGIEPEGIDDVIQLFANHPAEDVSSGGIFICVTLFRTSLDSFAKFNHPSTYYTSVVSG